MTSMPPPPPSSGGGYTPPSFAPQQNPWALQDSTDRFARDKFLVNQKVLSLGNKYFVYDESNSPLFFVDRPIFKLKAHYGIYADESKSQLLLSINQDSAFALINDSFTVVDPATNQTLGFLKRRGWMSLLRRTWHLQDATGTDIAIALEDSMWKAVVRRLNHTIGALFRTNFLITDPAGQPLGDFIRRFTLADKHVLDMTKDPGRTIDRRLALALGIVLDNDERKHSNG